MGTDGVVAVPSVPPDMIGDPGYLPWLFKRFERGLLTESEWHQADRAHRFVLASRRRA